MRAVIQRVRDCKVIVGTDVHAFINKGLLIFLGIEEADREEDIAWLSKKICQLRIFNDAAGVMNLSVKDVNADIMLVSQFTLHASTKKGNRPSYIRSARPDIAIPLYEKFFQQLEHEIGKKVFSGVFGAMMDVSFTNEGPVTILIDTANKE